MSETPKHTPGLWQWQHDFNCSPNWCSITAKPDDKLTYIADVYRGEADACLIAAAPDMLEALEAIVEYADEPALCDDPKVLVDLARAAIAKAKGEQP
jgi:hypothetical protein